MAQKKLRFNAEVKGDSILLDLFLPYKPQFPDGTKIVCEIKETKKPVRTVQQNRFLWGFVYRPVVDWLIDTGQEPDANKDSLHAFCLTEFEGGQFITKTLFGREYTVLEGATTTNMSQERFSLYIEKIIKHFSDLGFDWSHLNDADTSFIETKHIENPLIKILLN